MEDRESEKGAKETTELEKKKVEERQEKEKLVQVEEKEDEVKEKQETKSLLQDGVIFDGTNYRYIDPNGVVFIWNTEKNSWEKRDNSSESDETSKPKEELYGFDGTHHTYTDPKDKTTYIWDREKNAWFPKVDDDFLAQYQMNYGFVNNYDKPEDEKKIENPKPESTAKRKLPTQEASWFEVDDLHNTKVYVSNLPLDITEDEFANYMQKCGLVMKDINTGKWKVKLYTEKGTNTLKGDALCTYIKKESVDLALSVLDGSDLKGNIIKVERAKFEMKGDYNPALKPKKKKRKEKEREKKIQEKLLDWRPDKLRGEREKHERTVIIKNLFEPSIFDNQVELILEYSQDLRDECSKCGTIRKLVLYDKHPEGVAQVTFSDAEEADLCIKLLNNRWFGQRQITAETWDGKTKYKVVEGESEETKRLEKWNNFLESEDPK